MEEGRLIGDNRYSRVAIRHRQRPSLRDAGVAIDEDIVPLHGVAVLVAVEVGHDGQLRGAEVVLFDQHLRAHAAVDPGRRVVLETRAEDVARAEPERGQPRVHVAEVVVVVRHVQLARVFGAVAVAVAY